MSPSVIWIAICDACGRVCETQAHEKGMSASGSALRRTPAAEKRGQPRILGATCGQVGHLARWTRYERAKPARRRAAP